VALALVTGATGLVGSHIVERLHADGWAVRALVRDADRARWLQAFGAELVSGDVLDADGFARAAAGCQAIFHAAALVTPTRAWDTIRACNVDGTRGAITAARRSGARLLHVSSVAVYGLAARYRLTPTDETTPLAPLPEHAYYARTKREAEELVLAACGRGEIWAAVIRPDVIYGRRDRQFVPRAARAFSLGVVPLINQGRSTMAIVHAANVAEGAVRAVCSGMAGAVYNLANDYDVTVADFVRLAFQGLGRRPPLTPPFPLPLARAGVAVVRAGAALIAGRALAVQAGSTVDFLSRNNPFSSERARRELGWAPSVRPEDGIPEAFRWWKAQQA
jgi:2-alkyl-3-oxoalkanoate reductase